jgi:hypothetical protein
VDFRCAAESSDRRETQSGTASTVRSFLLVENNGPWGVDAMREARLPDRFLRELGARCAAAGVRPLLVRRHRRLRRHEGQPVRVFASFADAREPWLESGEVDSVDEILALDLEALGRGGSAGLDRVAGPLVCVCTHGRHDVCCAERGRPVAAALSRTHPGETWEVSHIGGDRFAANLLVLPHGLYFGRVEAASAARLVDDLCSGHLDLDLLRGRSAYRFPVQVAEVELLRHLGENRVDALELLSSTTRGDRTEARFSAGGRVMRVLVRRDDQPPRRLTCRSQRPGRPAAYQVLDIAEV